MSELQLELATVLRHDRGMTNKYCYANEPGISNEDTYKPLGVRLAKLLHQYDGSPSSELWRTIQSLSFEILRESK